MPTNIARKVKRPNAPQGLVKQNPDGVPRDPAESAHSLNPASSNSKILKACLGVSHQDALPRAWIHFSRQLFPLPDRIAILLPIK